MDVNRLRQQLPVCQKFTYVNTGWSGPTPLGMVNAIKARLDYEMNEGPASPHVYESGKALQAELQQAVSRLLNTSPDEILLTRNTTEGINTVINGLPWREGDEIITCSLEHSSTLVPAWFQQRRHGARLKVVELPPNAGREEILTRFAAAVTPRTRLIFLSHIEYSSGTRLPVKEIRRLLAGRDAWLLLDGAQTAGHIALDMKDIGCDFYAIPGQKWLLGPEGVGALYVRRELITLVEPVHVAGHAVLPYAEPGDFRPNTDSIEKFMQTSMSYPLQAGMLAAIRLMDELGIGAVEERNCQLAAAFKAELGRIPGVNLLSPLEAGVSSGLVSFTVSSQEPKDTVAGLFQQGIVARAVTYPPGARVSWHCFNTEDEVAKVAAAVRELAAA